MNDLKTVAASALDALRFAGADSAAVTARYTETREFNVDGGEFSLYRTLFDNSLSLTAFKEGKKGSLGINHFDEASVSAAAADCLAAAEAAQPDPAWELGPDCGSHSFSDGCYEPDMDKLFFRCRELMECISRDYPSILMEQMIVCHKKIDQVYTNTNGSTFEERSGYYDISLMFSAHEGDAGSSFFGSGFACDDLNTPFIEIGSVRRDLADVEKQIYPKPMEGKLEGTVLLTPGCLADVMMTALSTFADGYSVMEGSSLWKDKLGQLVADERLNVSLAPNDSRFVTGAHWTSDGYVTSDFDMIENGVLKSFLVDKYLANKISLERSPNLSLRQLVIRPGDKSVEDIISGIENGLVVSRVSGGNPASSGDFSMVAKNSFRIKNGKLGEAVSEVMINGNLSDMLKDLRAISKETVCDGYASLPWMAFDGVTIAGK